MSRITVATLFAALVAACGPDTNTPFEEARRALKAQKPAEAVPHLEKVLAAAQSMPPGGPRAELQAQAGRLLWSAQRTDLAEAALLDAAKQIEAAPASVSAKTSEETYRFLGVIYRDARRPQDATPWFERAVAANRRMPDSPDLEKRVKQLSLYARGYASAVACRSGNANSEVAE